MVNSARAVFLDRDGTISAEVGYIDNVDDFQLFRGSAFALNMLRGLGFKLIVVTNQSGVARGYFPESKVQEINLKMIELLANEGVTLDGIYYCPHLADGEIEEYAIPCECRKPGTGMILKAQSEHNIDLQRSVMIGDTVTDFLCGVNAGMTTIMVRTGYGSTEEKLLKSIPGNERPDYITDTLTEAVEWINENIMDSEDV